MGSQPRNDQRRGGRADSCTAKATCALSLCEIVTLRRGRGPDHARKVVFGTLETLLGPSVSMPMGALCEGRPEHHVEPKQGVGLVHSTDEDTEGNEVG